MDKSIWPRHELPDFHKPEGPNVTPQPHELDMTMYAGFPQRHYRLPFHKMPTSEDHNQVDP